jgi:colicin import membrane protein
VADFVGDTSTDKGRKEIAAMAYSVTRTKTYIETKGAALSKEYKAIPKLIDAGRKKIKEALEEIKDEVRKPLTEWEDAEGQRKADHCNNLDVIIGLANNLENVSVGAMKRFLLDVKAFPDGDFWEEYEEQARNAKADTIQKLEAAIIIREQQEREAKELAELRAKQAEAERIIRDQEIAEAAKRQAEETASQQAAQLIAEKEAAEERAIKAEAKAASEAIAAKRREEQSAQVAIEQERQAVAIAEQKRQAEENARKADEDHRRTINRAIVDVLTKSGISEEDAKSVVRLIASNKLPNVKLSY